MSCPKNKHTDTFCGSWCGLGSYYQGYPGSRRWAGGKPVLCKETGLPLDYKEYNNNERTEGTSSTPKK